jgi:hypothetical protein
MWILYALVMTTVIISADGSVGSKNQVGTKGRVSVKKCGVENAIGHYDRQEPSVIPEKFSSVCRKARWNPESMWDQLTDGKCPWFLKDDGNGAYIYYNRGDGKWWIDGIDGLGLYTASVRVEDLDAGPPNSGWTALNDEYLPLPTLSLED